MNNCQLWPTRHHMSLSFRLLLGAKSPFFSIFIVKSSESKTFVIVKKHICSFYDIFMPAGPVRHLTITVINSKRIFLDWRLNIHFCPGALVKVIQKVHMAQNTIPRLHVVSPPLACVPSLTSFHKCLKWY